MEKVSNEVLIKLRHQVADSTFRDHMLLNLIDEVLEWRKLAKEREIEGEKYAEQSRQVIRQQLALRGEVWEGDNNEH